MWAPNDKRWLLIFTPFLLLVVGTLLYLHLSDAETVPKPGHWDTEKALYVCDAPDWVSGNVEEAVEFVKPWATYSSVTVKASCSDIPEVTQCTFKGRQISCVEGAVLLTMASQGYDFGTMEEGGHGDESNVSAKKGSGEILYATSEFPGDLEDIRKIVFDDETLEIKESDWPVNAELLVVIHALLHDEGYDHVVNDLPGPFYAEPHGHIMARSIAKLGKSTVGL